MWDLGCTPPALVESSQLQKWNEARVSAGLDPLTTTYFDTPRKISGIGSEATTIIGSVMLPLTFQNRPLAMQAIVMTNGNTGVTVHPEVRTAPQATFCTPVTVVCG